MQPDFEVLPLADGRNADIVILHFRPNHYEALFREYSFLKDKYVIGYAVWEANDLPDCYQKSLSLVQEVWTSSWYCCNVFKQYHGEVIYMPHVIERDKTCSDADRSLIRELVDYDENEIYFLSIASIRDKRKNVAALLDTFRKCRDAMPKATLVIKARPDDKALTDSGDQIVYLTRQMTWSQINALYELTDVYASFHHGEGWGLTMSDAMIFHKPLVATGYSGNLEFMNAENSFLIRSSERNIAPEDCFDFFHSGMKWAYPNLEDASSTLVSIYNDPHGEVVSAKVRKASEDIARFDRKTVKSLLSQRLNTIFTDRL